MLPNNGCFTSCMVELASSSYKDLWLILFSKFGGVLEKAKNILPEIIESKISVKSQNNEGSRTHFDVTATVNTSKDQLIYTASGWDILKISDELCRKLEGEFSKHDDKRQRQSIRKKEY